jgi:outer membrane receptor for monomeric catechols
MPFTSLPSGAEDSVRIIRNKHHTWRDKLNLQQLTRIVKKNKDEILTVLERRIVNLKKRVVIPKGELEVDCVYEWSTYLKNENISAFK